MGARERKRLQQVYGRLYQWHAASGVGRDTCFYCSDPADTVDHCPPLSWIESRTIEAWVRQRIPFVMVACCRHCNLLLGDRPHFRVIERAVYLEQALLNRFDRESNLWSEEEIEDMSFQFQRMIRGRQARKLSLLERARYLQWLILRDERFPSDRSFRDEEADISELREKLADGMRRFK